MCHDSSATHVERVNLAGSTGRFILQPSESLSKRLISRSASLAKRCRKATLVKDTEPHHQISPFSMPGSDTLSWFVARGYTATHHAC